MDLMGNQPKSVIPTYSTAIQPELKKKGRCDQLHKAVQKLQKMMTLKKLDIELETETIMEKIERVKSYSNNRTFSHNKKELLEAACDKLSSFMHEEAKKVMLAFRVDIFAEFDELISDTRDML